MLSQKAEAFVNQKSWKEFANGNKTDAFLEKWRESQLTLHWTEFICLSIEIFALLSVFYELTLYSPEL